MTRQEPADPGNFYDIQTNTGWGRTLRSFVEWCHPQPGWITLDLGSGPGLVPALLAEQGCLSYGVDLALDAFREGRLHPQLIQADAHALPHAAQTFHLVTASNLLFLLSEPLPVLQEIKRVLKSSGQVVLLNPSEKLDLTSARELVWQRGLDGTAKETFLNWAHLAEKHWRWTEEELRDLFAGAGLILLESTLTIAGGLARLARGAPHN